MGLDVYTQIVFGVEIEQRKRVVQKTRYNETTGEPYQKDVEETFDVIKLTGQEVELDSDYYLCSDYEDLNNRFYGIVLTETSSHRHNGKRIVEVPQVSGEIHERMHGLLQVIGCQVQPRLFVMQCFSY